MQQLKNIWLISLVIKLVLSALIPLSADEAYYWVWSHRLQLSYFDHPPMVSWLFLLGHPFEWLGHAVRWPAVVLGHGTLLVWILILAKFFDLQKIKTWMLLVLFSPLLGFGSIIVTPDLPVIFFWSLSILFFLQIFQNQKLINYLGLGVALGLGFTAKYHIVLFVPCLLLYILAEKKWREIRWAGVLITILAGLIGCLPVLLWNYQNDFASFKFQIDHGLGANAYKFSWTTSYLLGQVLIIFPPILYFALKKHVRELRWALYFAWLPLVFFFLTSFRSLVEANWPIIAYPAVLALAASHEKIKRSLKVYIGFWGAIFALVIATLFIPSLRSLNEKIDEPYRLKELSAIVNEHQPLYANSYQVASSLWYFSKIPVFKIKDISRFDFFDTLQEATPQGTFFYLIKPENVKTPAWVFEQGFAIVKTQKTEGGFILEEYKK
ncbi:hypothetical protein BDW_14060 [Bdellovibrio bacteriovorus W]|nr:hypothetical protein BDW_14060 [Bdellovibrio bacteriovorus W]